MDNREWMYTGWKGKREWTDEFISKVNDFLEKAFDKGQRKAPCPCSKCENKTDHSKIDIGKHIFGGSAMVKPIVRETRSLGNAWRILMLRPGADTC